MTIRKIISGGQSGADQAGLKAAKAAGIETGGWAPRGWLVETGSAPWLAEEYGMKECPEPGGERPRGMPVWQWDGKCYVSRTRANARDSDATIWFGRGDSRGFGCTYNACSGANHRPLLTVLDPEERPPSQSVIWINGFRPKVVNIAGNRESKAPGIGVWVERYLAEVFRLLAAKETP